MHWGDTVQYRLDLVMWTLAGVLTPLISLAIWFSVSLHSKTGPDSQEVLAYYIALMFTVQATVAWHGYFFATDILNGKIIKHLLRPFAVIWQTIANNIVEKAIKIPTLLVAFLGMTYFFPQVTTIVLQHIRQPWLFLLSLLLALIISFTLETVLGYLAFWLEEAGEIIRFKFLFETVASGILVPYIFMPSSIVTILSLLPFRYIFSAPVEILIGQVTGQPAVQLISGQVVWVGVLTMTTAVMWHKGLKRYAIPGQ